MISLFKKAIILTFLLPILSGCYEEHTYDYLMEHPLVLQDDLANCREHETAQCKIVFAAADNISAIVSTEQHDPEQFGQKILDTEFAYVQAKNQWHAAKQTLSKLAMQHATAAQLKTAEEAVKKAELLYQERRREVKVLLAVAGMNSPE